MEILIVLAVLVVVVWFFFLRGNHEVASPAPYKVETPVNDQITDSVTQAPAPTPAWHTAPAEGTVLAENTLDVNHDGKVDLADIKEIVTKKPRKPRAPKVVAPAEKPAAKKAAPVKKAAAIKAKPAAKPAAKPNAKSKKA